MLLVAMFLFGVRRVNPGPLPSHFTRTLALQRMVADRDPRHPEVNSADRPSKLSNT